jgi:hypothetical protein
MKQMGALSKLSRKLDREVHLIALALCAFSLDLVKDAMADGQAIRSDKPRACRRYGVAAGTRLTAIYASSTSVWSHRTSSH